LERNSRLSAACCREKRKRERKKEKDRKKSELIKKK
jgi:hypothetical protein